MAGDGFVNGAAVQRRFGLARPPRLCRDVAQRDARLVHHTVREVERDSGGSQGDFVGLPVTDLQVERPPRPQSHWEPKAGDQLTGRENRLKMRGVARQPMQLFEWHNPQATGADDLDCGIERDQCLRKIAGVGSDALIADADGVLTVDTVERGAAGSRLAFTAGAPGTDRGNNCIGSAAARCRRVSPYCGFAGWRRDREIGRR